MNFAEVIQYIGSVEYEADMDIFSGWNLFLNSLMINDVVKELITEASKSDILKHDIETSLWSLVEATPDPKVMHFHDAGITTLLYVLNSVDSEQGEILARKLHERNDLWWGQYLVKDILYSFTAQTTVKTHIEKNIGFTSLPGGIVATQAMPLGLFGTTSEGVIITTSGLLSTKSREVAPLITRSTSKSELIELDRTA